MRKFFRRLSSKDSKLAPSYHHNGYNSSRQLDEARSTDVVSAVNPAFAAFQPRETSPQQRDLNGDGERDHESEDTNHEYLPADLARQPSSASARSFTSALNYSNGSALSPGSSHGKQHHHHPRRSHSQSVSNSIYNSSDAESVLSAQLGANDTASEGGWQPSRSSQKHSRSLSNSSDQYHRSTSMSPYLGRHSTSASSQTNGEHYLHGRVAPRSLPQSIYRSYDSDILSSGDHMLDRQDPLLATAPSADWIVRQALLPQSPVHRQDSLRRHSSKSRHGYSHSPKPPLARYADASSPSPRRSGRLNEGVPLPASPPSQRSHNPYKSTMREAHQPQQHPVTTPFAKYAQVSKSPSVDSQDLDTAMRGAAQAFSQRANMQADGVNGMLLTCNSSCCCNCMHVSFAVA